MAADGDVGMTEQDKLTLDDIDELEAICKAIGLDRRWNELCAAARRDVARHWQPIETAPSGKQIIATNGKKVTVAFRDMIPGNGPWHDLVTFFTKNKFDPTHWMPLPAAYQQKEAAPHLFEGEWEDLIKRLRLAVEASGRYTIANRVMIEAADALTAMQARKEKR